MARRRRVDITGPVESSPLPTPEDVAAMVGARDGGPVETNHEPTPPAVDTQESARDEASGSRPDAERPEVPARGIVPPSVADLRDAYDTLAKQVTANPDDPELRRAKREAHAAYWSALHP